MYKDFDELRSECLKCTKCGLCQGRHNVVFGVGNPKAKVLFVGEGPGENRERNIYIANIVKCRPPQNRDPLPEEQEACIDWLRNQFAIMRPKIIVCLGRIAGMKLMDPNMKITRQHGQFVDKKGTLMMATLHPAALLRNPNQKPDAFNDFLLLRDKIMEVCPETYDM